MEHNYNIYMIIRQYFVKICEIVGFQHNMQEFVAVYFGLFYGLSKFFW